CVHCRNSGYFGRVGIFELLLLDQEIAKCVVNRTNAREIEEIAVRNGMKTLYEAGLRYVMNGKTSVPEIMRVIKS
ncbi:type II secretion system protein GspE, partial [bacterium]|nr:type II secretion system protein GspE [bacterium]